MKTEDKSGIPLRHGAERPLLSLRQIEVLHVVLSTRSITLGAKHLGVSQPSISRTIKRIEDILRLRLFTKDGKRLAPTKEALLILAEVDSIMDQMNGLGRRIAQIANGDTGIFRVGATASVGRALVPQAIHALARKHPGLDLFLDVLSIDQLAQYLLNGTGDCLVTIAPDKHPALQTRKLGTGRLVALMAQDHPLARKKHLAATDLIDHEIICFQSDGPHQRAIASFLENVVDIANPRMVVRFSDTAIALADQGMGVALIDSFSLRGQIGPNLVAVPLIDPPVFNVYLQWNTRRPISRDLELLSDELRHLMTENT